MVTPDEVILTLDEDVKIRGSVIYPKIQVLSGKVEIPQNQVDLLDFKIITEPKLDVSYNNKQIYADRQGVYSVTAQI